MLFSKVSKYFNIGDARSIKYKRNIVWMFVLKGISLLISLLYIPLLLNSLDTENYGIWLTLTSIVSWVAMMDIGLGNGLRNKLSECLAENKLNLAKKYVSSAYAALSAYIAVFLAIFFLFPFRFISWNSVLNAPSIPADNLNKLVIIVFLTFGMQFVLNLVNSILLALQKPSLSSLLMTLGQLFSFVSVLVCVKVLRINSLLVLGSIVASTPVIVLLVSSLIIFCGKYRYLRPSLQYYDYSLVKDILRLGVVFFIIQFITIILYQSNNLIITHVIGNEGVVEYNIAHKYFQVLYTLYMIVVTPMWSATTQAYVLKDLQWIDKTQKNLNKVAMLFSGIGVIMLALSPVIYKLWLGDGNIHIAFTTSLLLFASEAFRMFYGNYGYIINGIGKLNAQLIITGAMTLIYLPVTLLLGKHWGLVGVLVMNALVNIVNFIWSKYQYKLILENKAKGFWNK